MDNLLNTLATYYQPESIYAWGEKLQALRCLTTLEVDGIGKMNLPLSLQNVEAICESYENSVPVTAIHIKELKQVSEQLATVAMSKAMEVDLSHLNISVKVDLVGMFVCCENEHEQRSNFRKGNGIAGNLVVQLPVANSSRGALLSVDVGIKRRMFDFSKDSHSHFYAAGIFGAKNMVNGAHFKIKAAEESPAVVLIFNLIWTGSLSQPCLSPTRFPAFLKAAHAVKQLFDDYISKTVDKNFRVCLPLKNSYEEANFNFGSLELMDKAYIEVFRSVKLLDFCMVVIRKEREQVTVECEGSEIQCEVIGDLDVELRRNFKENGVSLYPGLVLYRSQRAEIIGEVDEMASVNEEIHELKKRIVAAERSQKEAFLFCSRLRSVIKIVDAKSQRIHDELPSISRILLEFCSRLKASQEGVLLIDLMARKLPFTYAEFIYSEGDIQRGLNELIVEFVCSVCGWDACSSIFIDVIKKKFDYQVCSVFVDMATKFSCRNNKATEEITDKIIEKLQEISMEAFQEGNHFNHMPKIAKIINQLQLEDDKTLGNLEEVLLKMTFSQICHLIEEVIENLSCLMQGAFCLAVTESTFDSFSQSQVHHLTNNYDKQPLLIRSVWLRICHQITEEVKSNRKSSLEDFFVTELTGPERNDLLKDIAEKQVFHRTCESLIESFIKKSKREENSEKILSYYYLVMFADGNLADDKFVDSFIAVFSQLSSEKLCSLNVKLFDDEGDDIKQRSTSMKIFSCLSNEILRRDLWIVMKSFNEFEEVAANIVWLDDAELDNLLLIKVFEAAKSAYNQGRACEIACFLSNFTQLIEKRDLLASVKSQICSFLYIWYNSIIKVIQEKKFEDSTADSFLRVLVKVEEKNLISEDESIYGKFASLSLKFPLILVKQVIVKLNQENMKKSPSCMKIYRDLSMKFINHVNLAKTFSTLPHEELLPLLKIFLMLKEEEPIKTLGKLICMHPLRDSSFSEFTTELQAKKVAELARGTDQGVKTLAVIIEHCIGRLKETLQSKTSWALPFNPGTQNEEVNKFLMSDKQMACFGAYQYRAGALNFGKRMVKDSKWGIECKPVLVNSKFACEFVKTKQFPPPKEYLNVIENEIDQLTTLLASLINKPRSKIKSPIKKTPLGASQGDNIKSNIAMVKKTLFVIEETAESPAKRRKVL